MLHFKARHFFSGAAAVIAAVGIVGCGGGGSGPAPVPTGTPAPVPTATPTGFSNTTSLFLSAISADYTGSRQSLSTIDFSSPDSAVQPLADPLTSAFIDIVRQSGGTSLLRGTDANPARALTLTLFPTQNSGLRQSFIVGQTFSNNAFAAGGYAAFDLTEYGANTTRFYTAASNGRGLLTITGVSAQGLTLQVAGWEMVGTNGTPGTFTLNGTLSLRATNVSNAVRSRIQNKRTKWALQLRAES